MKLPHPLLLRAYGTDDVFRAKTANVQPLAARMGDLIMMRGLANQMEHARVRRQTVAAEMMNTAFRALELARMEATIDNANHTVPPMILPPGTDLPIGMTEGMVRIASAAGAKLADAEPFNIGQKATELLQRTGLNRPVRAAGTLAAGYAGMKAMTGAAKGITGWLSHEPRPRIYNYGGMQLANDINQYGEPVRRLSSLY